NGCARAKGPANPSGGGRLSLIRRCRLLIGYRANRVGSASTEEKSAALAATGNTQTGSSVDSVNQRSKITHAAAASTSALATRRLRSPASRSALRRVSASSEEYR